jgi:transcriptional regulator with XRE-family HTH domain
VRNRETQPNTTKEAILPKTIVDVAALYGALNDKRDRQGVSWRELANELQLSPSTFTRMAQGQRPDIDTFSTVLHWLGMPAEKYTRIEGESPKRHGTKAEPLVEISTLLRSSKSIKPDQAEALNDIITAAYRSIVKD